MLKPDYHNSIVNLTASIGKLLGVTQDNYEPLQALQALELNGQPLVMLIVDGLGYSFLKQHPNSFLHTHLRERITSVFPSTTATAITSFFTGVAPQQHAITGWYTYFKEMGTVAAVLPFTPRYKGECFSAAGISAKQLIDHDSLLHAPKIPCHIIQPNSLIDTDYSQSLSGKASRHGYGNLAEMFTLIENLARMPQPGVIFGYWPELDGLAHAYGIESRQVAHHFQEIDTFCRKSLAPLADSGVKIVITADHGLIDTSKKHTIHLDDHPELAATLTLPLCGEPRCAFCYVRSDQREQFERYVIQKLGFACELKTSSELIEKGYFGNGTPSPRLESRVGEYALLMKGNYTISDRLINEKTFQQTGVHGGLSEQELYVPLITLGL